MRLVRTQIQVYRAGFAVPLELQHIARLVRLGHNDGIALAHVQIKPHARLLRHCAALPPLPVLAHPTRLPTPRGAGLCRRVWLCGGTPPSSAMLARWEARPGCSMRQAWCALVASSRSQVWSGCRAVLMFPLQLGLSGCVHPSVPAQAIPAADAWASQA